MLLALLNRKQAVLFLIQGGGYVSYNLTAFYEFESPERKAEAGLQYNEEALNITGKYLFGKNFLEDKAVSVKLGAGMLLHTEFVKDSALIADLLFPFFSTFFINRTKTSLNFTLGAGYKHTFVYELLQYDIYLIVPNAILSARLNQNLFDRLDIGVSAGTYNYFNYPRLIKPTVSFDAKYKCSENWLVGAEWLFAFTSISAQENVQVEHSDFRFGVIYVF